MNRARLIYTKLDGTRNTKEFESREKLELALAKAKSQHPGHSFGETVEVGPESHDRDLPTDMRTVEFESGTKRTDFFGIEGDRIFESTCHRPGRWQEVLAGWEMGIHRIAVKSFRAATAKEREAFFRSAEAIEREVMAEENHGSTKTLPRGWSISRRGRTLDQFRTPVN